MQSSWVQDNLHFRRRSLAFLKWPPELLQEDFSWNLNISRKLLRIHRKSSKSILRASSKWSSGKPPYDSSKNCRKIFHLFHPGFFFWEFYQKTIQKFSQEIFWDFFQQTNQTFFGKYFRKSFPETSETFSQKILDYLSFKIFP